MDYEEKSELKKEITKSAKRSMKTCILLSIVILAVEAFISWALYQAFTSNMPADVAIPTIAMLLMLRGLQGTLISFYEAV